MRKEPRLVEVDVELESGRLGEALQEVREEAASRPAADYRDARAILQCILARRRLDERSGDVMRAERCYPMAFISPRRDVRRFLWALGLWQPRAARAFRLDPLINARKRFCLRRARK
jgi:hypothetical protein